MKTRLPYFFLGLLLLNLQPLSGQQIGKFHSGSTIVDTHNDILTTVCAEHVNIDTDLGARTHSDIPRLRKGGVDAQFFSVWCDGNKAHPYQWANREIDSLYAIALRNWQEMEIPFSFHHFKRIIRKKRLAALIGVEGGHMIEDDLSKIDSLYKRGARYMTLTWNNSTNWATSAMDESKKGDSLPGKGLTDFGKQVVQRMNKLGMMVDLSHVGEQTFWDAIQVTKKPVIVSHSCVYTLCPVFRNLKDDQIKAVAENKGVICLNFYSGFLDSNYAKRADAFTRLHQPEKDSLLGRGKNKYEADVYLFAKYKDEVENMRPPLSLLLDHLDYVVKLAGINHVGLGSDFDGIESFPKGLKDATSYPDITAALLKRGYSRKQVQKIMGKNVIRVLKANQR